MPQIRKNPFDKHPRHRAISQHDEQSGQRLAKHPDCLSIFVVDLGRRDPEPGGNLLVAAPFVAEQPEDLPLLIGHLFEGLPDDRFDLRGEKFIDIQTVQRPDFEIDLTDLVIVQLPYNTQGTFAAVEPVQTLIPDNGEDIGREIGTRSDSALPGAFQIDAETLHDQIFGDTGVTDIASGHGFETRLATFEQVGNFFRFRHLLQREQTKIQ